MKSTLGAPFLARTGAGQAGLDDRLHALRGERAGVLDLLLALAVRPGVEHPAGAELLLELGILRVRRQLVLLDV
jgi:hypothetical protein